MQLGHPVANFRWFHRPLLTFTRYHRLHFSSAAPPVMQRVGEDCKDFLPWLEAKAGVKISSFLSIGKSAYGRSLFASKSIESGDCMLKVPYSVQISPENGLPEINAMLDDVVDNVAKLAILILVEQKIGQDSEWDPYIRCLPKIGEMQNTIFWSDDEMAVIRQSTVYRETMNLKVQIEMEYLKTRPVLHQFPAFFKDITLEDFMHVYAVGKLLPPSAIKISFCFIIHRASQHNISFTTTLGSRAWGSKKGISLIPFADFLNHDGDLGNDLLSDEVKECFEVVADRNYVPGEQVLIRYGKFSNATLLLDFGFTHPHNIHDQVWIQLSIPHDDHLRTIKLDLLQRYSKPIVKDVNNFKNSWDSFTIKEVRCARGKGKGIPQSLRAFARVLCCTSLDELSSLAMEATQNDGRLARYPLKSRIQELKAHQILLSHITELIQQHAGSIKALGHVYASSECEKLSTRRTMAQDLLTGELRVLKSAKVWLDNYCVSLTTNNSIKSDDYAGLLRHEEPKTS